MFSDTAILTYDQQAERLLGQGLQADKAALMRRLHSVGVNRLADYASFFSDGNGYAPGTTLQAVWNLYEFDRSLRSLCLEALAVIEVQVRTRLSYHFAHKHGALAYRDEANFPKFGDDNGRTPFYWWENKINSIIDRESKGRVGTASSGIVQAPALPIWDVAEDMDFGMTLAFFSGVSTDIQKTVASVAGQPDKVILSWLLGLRDLRNRCAHHRRVWNRHFRIRVRTPQHNKFPEWHSPRLPNQQIGILLTICRYWLNRIQPGNSWSERVVALFDAHLELPASAMGLPADWRRHPFWAG